VDRSADSTTAMLSVDSARCASTGVRS
jgi:hypothetical protein